MDWSRRLTIRRLERKIKTMEEDSTSGGGQKVVVLQHLLEDANRMKSQFEKDYLEASQERDILNSDMARIREGIPDALLDQSQNTMSLRLHIIDMEKESKSLRDRNAKLEARIAQGSFSDASGDQGDLKAKYQDLETRANELEEQTKKQLQDINKLLLEKDMLQSQSIEHKDLLLEKERVNRYVPLYIYTVSI
jgi:protein HOOK3